MFGIQINTCCRKEKMCWEDQSGANKKGTVRGSIKEVLKKENKRIRPDRTRLLQKYVPYTKDTSHFWIVWNRSVFEHSAMAVNTQRHLAVTRVDIARKKPAGNLSLSSVSPPEIQLPAPEFRQ